MAHKPKTAHHLSRAQRRRRAANNASFRRWVKAHPFKNTPFKPSPATGGTKPKKVTAGELGMCAFEAAGLITGGDALQAYMDYGAPVDGATIPEALNYMGATPVEAVTFTPGTILALTGQAANHAVVINDVDVSGMWVWSWGEPHWLTWDYVYEHGEDAWQAR